MDLYFGTYQAFSTDSKNEAAALLGADNLIGDFYDIDIELNDEGHKAWLINRFNKKVGYFDADFSRKLSIMKAREFKLRAALSFVAYTDRPDPGYYWGEMAVFCYDQSHGEIFDAFTRNVAERMMDGQRPDIDLSHKDVNRVLESNGTWIPDAKVPLPKKKTGTAIMKSKRSLNEKMIEQGRKGNIGCYIVSWAFIIGLIALAFFGLRSCGLF